MWWCQFFALLPVLVHAVVANTSRIVEEVAEREAQSRLIHNREPEMPERNTWH